MHQCNLPPYNQPLCNLHHQRSSSTKDPIKSIDPATQSIDRSYNLQDQRRYNHKTQTPSRLLPRVRSQIYKHTQIQTHTLLFPHCCCCVPRYLCIALFTCYYTCCPPAWNLYISPGLFVTWFFSIRSFVCQKLLPFSFFFFCLLFVFLLYFCSHLHDTCFDCFLATQDNDRDRFFPDRLVIFPLVLLPYSLH